MKSPLTPLLTLILLIIAPFTSISSAETSQPPSIFISAGGLSTIKSRIQNNVQPYKTQYDALINRANSLLNSEPSPFKMNDITKIEFGWCASPSGEDNTLKELTEKITKQSDVARNLALAFLLSGNTDYAVASKSYLLSWARNSTLLNLYDLNIDFNKATFDGMETGFCNNSWNMGLDTIWQGYGLINFSDAYSILTRNSYILPADEKTEIEQWLKYELVPATNSGFHAWTRWADKHPSSSAYTRYRSDNHLGWALAGITSAAAALNDEQLWQYAINGGEYDDGHSGPYSNPSNLEALLDYAILDSGQVYDQKVRAGEHKGFHYGNFHMWALSISVLAAEIHKGQNYWTYKTSKNVSLASAYDYYAPYVSGELPIPDKEETTNPKFFRFLFEMVYGNEWVSSKQNALYKAAMTNGNRDQFIQQTIGPFPLVVGDLAMNIQSRNPMPPSNIQVRPE